MPAGITSLLAPFPTRACLPRTSPLYTRSLLPAGISAAASRQPGRERCGGGRAPRLPPRLPRSPGRSRDQSRRLSEGRQDRRAPQLGTPLPNSSVPRALGGRGAGTAIPLPAEPLLRTFLAGRPGRRCGDTASPEVGEPCGRAEGSEHTAPLPRAEAGGRGRRRRPSPEHGELRRALERRRGLCAAPRGAPSSGSERSLAGGGEGPPASSFLPCLQLTLHQGRRRRRNPLKVSIQKARSEPPIPAAEAFCTSNNNALTAALFIC